MANDLHISVIGLGSMGASLAKNILAAGYPLSVYNRTPQRATALVAAGARAAASPLDAACGADVVITMLADDKATEDVVFGADNLIDGLKPGAIHIAMSTISEALSIRLTAAHHEAGQVFVAAPVLGRPDAAAAAKLFIAVAGPSAAVQRVTPVLEKLGQRVTVIGENPAQAHLLKLVANFMISAVLESLGEATALAHKGGIDPETMLDFLTNSIFSAPVYKNYGALIAKQTFTPVGFALPLGQKDNRLVLQSAEAHQVPMPFASVVRDRFLSARAQGYDDQDWAAIARLSLTDAGMVSGKEGWQK
jgi:3-hydroxyisobutyrate dehydrogenase-like beta-hydroxyacid dehydrogenase